MKLNPKQLAVSAALLTLLAAGAALPATDASPISAPAAITLNAIHGFSTAAMKSTVSCGFRHQ